MSEQILLQGKILGIEEFLLSPPGGALPARSNGEELLAGRSQWITLLCEVLPRALLAEFGLARVLLGSSGGGQFLLVLPGESAIGPGAPMPCLIRNLKIFAVSSNRRRLYQTFTWTDALPNPIRDPYSGSVDTIRVAIIEGDFDSGLTVLIQAAVIASSVCGHPSVRLGNWRSTRPTPHRLRRGHHGPRQA